MCMKPDFLNTILKEPDGFSEYVKLLIYYGDRKLENCYLTIIFIAQRIKEKLNNRFDYSF